MLLQELEALLCTGSLHAGADAARYKCELLTFLVALNLLDVYFQAQAKNNLLLLVKKLFFLLWYTNHLKI